MDRLATRCEETEVLEQCLAWRKAGKHVFLTTVVKTWGSSPRPVGALFAFSRDGDRVGSVSGGCVDDDLVLRLRDSAPPRPFALSYGVTPGQARSLGLPCGGRLELVVEPVFDPATLDDVLDALGARRLIGRRLRLADGSSTVFAADGSTLPLSFDGRDLCRVFGPQWRLLLVGAGELSKHIARMAPALGYRVLLCEVREDYLRSWDLEHAELVGGMPDDAVRTLQPDARTAVLALTHDPKIDDLALMEALRSDAFYVGALGSRRNNERRRERLAEHFGLSEAHLERLRGPVGLALGSRTPAEIAVAVLAELIAVRSGSQGPQGAVTAAA